MIASTFRNCAVAICLSTLVLGSVACSSSSAAEPDDTSELTEPAPSEVKQQFAQANEALDDGDWERAAELYGQVVDADPDRWDAHMNRGIALMRSQEFSDAVDAFDDALSAGGDTEPVVYFNLGNLYQERGQYQAAIDAYRTSMAVRGELDYETLLNISASFVFLHAHDEARQTIERAMELEPDDPRSYLTLGLLEQSEENPDRALEIYDELVATEPEMGPAHYNRGYVLMRMGKNEQALEAFDTYLEVAPDGPYVQQTKSNISTIEDRLDR